MGEIKDTESFSATGEEKCMEVPRSIPPYSRFDYVKYDEKAMADQITFKSAFVNLEGMANMLINSPRAKALVMTKLEEAYMWVGKAIRDDQIARGVAPLQEERRDS